MNVNTQIQLLLLIFIPLIGAAQIKSSANFEYETGKPYRYVYGLENYYFYKNDKMLAVKIDNMEVTLQKFNTLTLSIQSDKIYKDFPVDWVVEQVTEYNNRYFVFYALWDRDANKEQLFYREIDFEKGIFKDKGTLVIQIDGKITGTYSGIPGRAGVVMTDKFDFKTAFDTSCLMVKYRKHPDSKSAAKNQDILGFCVFDRDMQMLWHQDVKMPYTEKKMNYLDYAVDKKGDVFILSTVFTDNSSKMKLLNGNSNYNLELLSIQANTQMVDKFPVPFGDKLINSIEMYQSANEELICVGFYNYGQDIENANGLFFFKQSSEGVMSKVKFFDFQKEVVNQHADKKTVRQNSRSDEKAEIEHLILRNLELAADGSMVIVGEQAYSKQGPKYMNDYSEDIFVCKLSPEGELVWENKVAKRQWGNYGPESGLSFNQLSTKGNQYFFYLDHKDNLDLPIDEIPEKHHDGFGGFLTCSRINDLSGETSKYSVFNLKDVNGMVVSGMTTKNSVKISDDKLIFEVSKGTRQMVLISLKIDN